MFANSLPRNAIREPISVPFRGRTFAELRASLENLSRDGLLCTSVVLSSVLALADLCISRYEREAVGNDGERYSWTKLYINEFRDGRVAAA